MIKNQDFRCFYCRVRLTNDLKTDAAPTFDHRVPKSQGGRKGTNLVVACRPCNHWKGDRTEQDLRDSQYFRERLAYVARRDGALRCDDYQPYDPDGHYCATCDQEVPADDLDFDKYAELSCYRCRLQGCVDDLCHGRGFCEHSS
ncbi:MAG TPA: HNH endonuclease [Acidimicrobiales bacterium]|nr:HNH endonuclease [Acidimicrobiales bacterium]